MMGETSRRARQGARAQTHVSIPRGTPAHSTVVVIACSSHAGRRRQEWQVGAVDAVHVAHQRDQGDVRPDRGVRHHGDAAERLQRDREQITQVLQGEDVTVFSFGQTGSPRAPRPRRIR